MNTTKMLEGLLDSKKMKIGRDLEEELIKKEKQLSDSLLRTSVLRKKISIIKREIKTVSNFKTTL